jgi:predicted hydrocarbon binding protein/acetolactate synthase regulatory subunit
MAEKHVIVHQFNPLKVFYEVMVTLKNRPGALSRVLDTLARLGVNVLSGYSSVKENSETGVWCSFVEAGSVDPVSLKSTLEGLPDVVNVSLTQSKDGLIVDTMSFPLTWNTGERAILIGQDRFARMLDRLRDIFGVAGHVMIYQEGFVTGEVLGGHLISKMGKEFVVRHMPEILQTYSAAGVGQVGEVEFNLQDWSVKVVLKESMECTGHSSKSHYSEFIRGNLAGLLTAITGEKVSCEERRCVASGDDFCEFRVLKL